MKQAQLFGSIASLFIFSICVMAQDDVVTPSGVRQRPTMEQVRNRDFQRRREALDRLIASPREMAINKPKRLTKAEKKRFKEATTPAKEDKERYKEFLKQSNTGIIRLLPNNDCETKDLVRVDGNCAGYVPGTWAYSLRFRDYSNNEFHDVAFEKDKFVSRGLLSQALFVKLPEGTFENASLGDAPLASLMRFAPAENFEETNRQYREISAGMVMDGFEFSNTATAEINAAYGLRIIAYRYGDKWTSRLWEKNQDKVSREEVKFGLLKFDKRFDAVYVLKAIRKGDDGGLTILWRRLLKKRSPKLVFSKNEKLRDFKLSTN